MPLKRLVQIKLQVFLWISTSLEKLSRPRSNRREFYKPFWTKETFEVRMTILPCHLHPNCVMSNVFSPSEENTSVVTNPSNVKRKRIKPHGGSDRLTHTRSFLVETDGTRCTQWWFDVRRWSSHKSEERGNNVMISEDWCKANSHFLTATLLLTQQWNKTVVCG